jgi:hypothetical protein
MSRSKAPTPLPTTSRSKKHGKHERGGESTGLVVGGTFELSYKDQFKSSFLDISFFLLIQ